MHAEVIRDDDKNLLGISLQQTESGDNQVLEKFMSEGMLPVSYTPKEGLLVAFGRKVATETDEESEEDEPPTEASMWIG